jgi:hypothetical protein
MRKNKNKNKKGYNYNKKVKWIEISMKWWWGTTNVFMQKVVNEEKTQPHTARRKFTSIVLKSNEKNVRMVWMRSQRSLNKIRTSRVCSCERKKEMTEEKVVTRSDIVEVGAVVFVWIEGFCSVFRFGVWLVSISKSGSCQVVNTHNT